MNLAKESTAGTTAGATTGNQGLAIPRAGGAFDNTIFLPGFNLLPSRGDASSGAGQNKTADATPTTTGGAGDTTGSSTTNAAGGSNALTHSLHGNSSAAQNTQPDGSQAAAPVAAAPVAAKTADAGAPAMAPIAAQGVVRETATPAAGNGTGDVSRPRDTAGVAQAPIESESTAPAGTSGINTARLIQTMSETEMRVGMRSAEFGDISIRTSVSQEQILAQISVDHGDLGRMIVANAGAVQTKIGDDSGLHASIEVSQSGINLSGERGYSSHQEQRSFAPSVQVESAGDSVEAENLSVRLAATVRDEGRLDIVA